MPTIHFGQSHFVRKSFVHIYFVQSCLGQVLFCPINILSKYILSKIDWWSKCCFAQSIFCQKLPLVLSIFCPNIVCPVLFCPTNILSKIIWSNSYFVLLYCPNIFCQNYLVELLLVLY